MPKIVKIVKKTVTKAKKPVKAKVKNTKEKQRKDKKEKQDKERVKAFGLISATDRMYNIAEYAEYIKFVALPRVLREEILGIKTKADFTKKYNISEVTVYDWQNREGFWEDVHNFRKQFFKGRAGDVWLALENNCIKKGQGQDVKVYFTLTGDYQEKLTEEHQLSPEVKKAIDKIGEFLKK